MNVGREQPDNQSVNLKQLRVTVLVRLLAAIVLLGLMFCLPAGTIQYWQAWAYIAILIVPASVVMVHLLRKDPELLARRMKTKEKEREQKKIVRLSYVFFFLAFLIPGFDRRYGWSDVPLVIVVVADIVVLLGYLIFVLVLRENRYASRVIEVAEGQKVVSTGPYAVVRHPMYLANLLIYVFSPLALGSFWATPVLTLGTILMLVHRIRNEEEVLAEKLDGYREFVQRTRFRLIPGVW